jgi:AraC-like DNA-binding protein
MSRSKGFLLESNWRFIAGELGIRLRDVLCRAGLPADLLARGNVRLGADEYFRFWKGVESEARDPLLPLRLVEIQTSCTLCPPYVAALCCPNLAMAAERIARYKRLVTPVALQVLLQDDALTLQLRWPNSVSPPTVLVLTEAAFLTQVAREGVRGDLLPQRIVLSRPLWDVEALDRIFGMTVESGLQTALSFTFDDAMQPFMGARGSMPGSPTRYRHGALTDLDENASTRDRVWAVLCGALPSGQCTMVDVASRLALSRRTLQRRLSGEGTTFQQVLSRIRESLARYYLANTTLSCTQISFLLGFEDPNSFFRAFHDWTGSTPERLRSTPPAPLSMQAS